MIGDGVCDYMYNTTECGWEGGDCLPAMMAISAPTATSIIPIVLYLIQNMIGDGRCDGMSYNTRSVDGMVVIASHVR